VISCSVFSGTYQPYFKEQSYFVPSYLLREKQPKTYVPSLYLVWRAEFPLSSCYMLLKT
jgi:hypothetical protein